MIQKILVTAANGNTGFPAAKELLELGFPVRAFVRNPDKPKAQSHWAAPQDVNPTNRKTRKSHF